MNKITDLKQINQDSPEGRLLMAAIIQLTTHHFPQKTPYDVLELLEGVAVNCVDEVKNTCSTKSISSLKPFDVAIEKHFQNKLSQKTAINDQLKHAGNVILSASESLLQQHEHYNLSSLLVKVYEQAQEE